VIKKQMKIVSKTEEEYNIVKEKLKDQYYYTENVIKQINNPEARRIKFKDERKITIGISKKDIMNSRGKMKNAFYNCFAIIIRFMYEDSFREIHVKIFNTGKLEIPGILNKEMLILIKGKILILLSSILPIIPEFVETHNEHNVLINSNFTCGYFVNREKLYTRLKFHYKINSAYDPCSYPGIQCEFYYNKKDIDGPQNGQQPTGDQKKDFVKISFMIFRTGSVLIVGKCTEYMLNNIYAFLKDLLEKEYKNVGGKIISNEKDKTKIKTKKIRKKTIIIS